MDRSEFVVILSRLRNLHPNWFDLPADRRVDDDWILRSSRATVPLVGEPVFR